MTVLLMGLGLALAQAPAASQATTPASPAAAGAAEHRDKARQVIDLVMPPGQRDVLFASMMDSMIQSLIGGMMSNDPSLAAALEKMPEAGPVFARFVERQRSLAMADFKAHAPEMVEAMTSAYARHFSADELTSLQSFFSSPAGRKYVATSPMLLRDEAVAAWQRNLAAAAQARQDAELHRFMEELAPILRAHSEKPRGS